MSIGLRGRTFNLLIFDMDGVLVSTSPCHEKAYAELWQQLDIAGPGYEKIAGRVTREVIAEVTMVLQPTATQIEEWTHFKQQRARDLIKSVDICFSDTVKTLHHLSGLGIELALGTAASGKTTQMILDRYGLSDYFSTILTAEMVNSGKPAPDIYRQITREANVDPEYALVIEDSMAGIEAAIRADCCAVSVRTGAHYPSDNFLGTFPNLARLVTAQEPCQ